MRRLSLLLIVGLLVMAGFAPAVAQPATPLANAPDLAPASPLLLVGDRRSEFEAYVAAMMTDFDVPGVSVAVVQHGELTYLQGFGTKEVGGNAPVGPDTLMMLGSVTKSTTSLLAATLVDDARLGWETPVVDLLPVFATADPALTERLTVADTFCMCTGVPRRDAEFMLRGDRLDPDALVRSIAGMPLTAPYGERYQYSNQLYAVGGYAAAVAAGAAEDDLFAGYQLAMRERVLGPIGMERSTFSLEQVLQDGDYATGHGIDFDGRHQSVPLLQDDRFVDAVAPAGALWSSAREMSRYVETLLGGGTSPNGVDVVSAENLARLWEPRVDIPADPNAPNPPFTGDAAYALGWYVGEYKGLEVIAHTGGTFGFSALVSLVPEADLGLVVLTNGLAGAFLAPLVQFRLLELVYDLPSEGETLMAPFVEATIAQFAEIGGGFGEVDPQAVAPFVGRYANPILGEARVTLDEGELRFNTGAIGAALQPLAAEPGQPIPYLFAEPPLTIFSGAIVFVPGEDGRPMMLLTVVDPGGEEPVTYAYERIETSSG